MPTLSPLTELESNGLVRRLEELDLSYLFKHALVQDTAYTSLLRNERRRLHRAVADALAELYPDALDENAARLAQHYVEAGDAAKTFHYALRAGDAAAHIFAYAEAITFYTLAAQNAPALNVDALTLIALHSKLGRVYEVSGNYARALDLYTELGTLAAARNDTHMELASLMLRATLHATPTSLFDAVLGQQLLDQALVTAQRLQDRTAQAKIYWNLLLLNGFTFHTDEAIRYGELGIEIARPLEAPEQLAYLLNDIGVYGYFASGRMVEGRAALTEARQLWQQLGNLPMLADNLDNSALLNVLSGDFVLSTAEAKQAHSIATSINNVWNEALSALAQSMVQIEHGDLASAVGLLLPAQELALAHSLGISLIGGTLLAFIYTELGALDQAGAVIETATANFDIPLYQVPSRAMRAYIAILQGEIESARTLVPDYLTLPIEAAILFPQALILLVGELEYRAQHYTALAAHMADWAERLRSAGLWCSFADVRWYQARAHLALAEYARARQSLDEARAHAEQLDTRRLLWKILAAQSELESLCHNPSLATDYLQAARAEIGALVNLVPPEYRAQFLARPDIQRVLNG